MNMWIKLSVLPPFQPMGESAYYYFALCRKDFFTGVKEKRKEKNILEAKIDS